jgi:NADH-quinone oxidoreductase subunit L
MFDAKTLLILIPAMPLLAAVLTAALGPRVLRGRSHLPTVLAIGLSFAASLLLLLEVRREGNKAAAAGNRVGYESFVHLWTWANIDGAQLPSPAGGRGAIRLPSPFGRGAGGEGIQPTGSLNALTLALSQRERGPDAALSQGERGPDAALSQRERERDAALRPFHVEVTLRADALTAVMLATVTLVSLLVAVYSIGYMHGDRGYWRFFSYISLFVFSMTMLVSVSNFALLYVFWEAVGLCSYLLIGFWYHKPEAAAAGKKAFLVNRVGDFGFALGVFLLWTTYGTLDFHDTVVYNGSVPVVQNEGILGQTMLQNPALYAGGAVGTAICLLLMLGACGKSAQLPLHVWLPDAMEGPTPVSALIHAATMVTAGVYMVARCTPLFAASAEARTVVAVIGAATALMAAVIALTQTDLKRILAYSTISQLGYMFLGLGTGTLLGITAAMFHLFTHAFFKALLFLGAGSVMHAMGGVVDVRRLGGLRHRLPWTHATFLFGCLALAGVFPFAGFWSKDLILGAVADQSAAPFRVLYLVAAFTALLTAVYTFRAFFLTFYGDEQIPHEAGGHAHESPPSMLVPLVVLAAGALVAGAWFELTHGFADFLRQTPSLAFLATRAVCGPLEPATEPENALTVALTGTVLALAGIALAAMLYFGRRGLLRKLTGAMDAVGLYPLSYGKFFVDQIYGLLVVWPLGAVARLSFWIDRNVIDGLVNLCGLAPMIVGASLRPLQNGLIQFYALAMVLGLLVLIGALMM